MKVAAKQADPPAWAVALLCAVAPLWVAGLLLLPVVTMWFIDNSGMTLFGVLRETFTFN